MNRRAGPVLNYTGSISWVFIRESLSVDWTTWHSRRGRCESFHHDGRGRARPGEAVRQCAVSLPLTNKATNFEPTRVVTVSPAFQSLHASPLCILILIHFHFHFHFHFLFFLFCFVLFCLCFCFLLTSPRVLVYLYPGTFCGANPLFYTQPGPSSTNISGWCFSEFGVYPPELMESGQMSPAP